MEGNELVVVGRLLSIGPQRKMAIHHWARPKKRQILGTDDGRRQIALRSAAKGRGGNKVMKKWPEQPKLILGRGPIVLFFALVLSALCLRNEMDGAATTPMDQSTWRRPVCHPDSVPPSIKGRQEQEEHKQ